MIVTSVKDFSVEREATQTELGRGRFIFSDRYSVFDWGEMPDHIPEKGASLCTSGAFNFELLEREGIATHYRGVHDSDDGDVQALNELDEPPRQMAIELTQVPDLPFRNDSYDYDHFHQSGGENYLIPLEIVFRNRISIGSSLRRRSKPSDHGMDMNEWPDEAVELEQPIVEFSTKYEEQDRYLERKEASKIAGEADLEELKKVALNVNEVITQQADSQGLTHVDGKIECFYIDGEIRVADVVGTLDENRFSYNELTLSKEFLRQYYRNEHPEWVKEIKQAKEEAQREGNPDWKSICSIEPQPLPDDILRMTRQLYCSTTNRYTNREWFDSPPLEDVVEQLENL